MPHRRSLRAPLAAEKSLLAGYAIEGEPMAPPKAKRPRTEATVTTAESTDSRWAVLRRSTQEDLANTHDPGWRAPSELAAEHRAALSDPEGTPATREVAAVALGLAAVADIRAGGSTAEEQWSSSVAACCGALEADEDAAVRHAASQSIASLGCPALSGERLVPQLRELAQVLSRTVVSDPDGDVRAAAAKALSAVLGQAASASGSDALPLLTAVVETLAARVQAEPLIMVRQVALKALGKIGGELCEAISAAPAAVGAAPAVAALGDATCAVVAQLTTEDSADWRAAVPGVLSQLQLPAAASETKENTFAPALCELLGHAHEGVSRTAAAALIAMVQAISTGEGGCGTQILSSLATALVTGKNQDERGGMAVLAVVQEAFGETKWNFADGGLWVQGQQQVDQTENAAIEAAPRASKLRETIIELAVACVSCLTHGDAEPMRGSAEEDDDHGEDDAERQAAIACDFDNRSRSLLHDAEAPRGSVGLRAFRVAGRRLALD